MAALSGVTPLRRAIASDSRGALPLRNSIRPDSFFLWELLAYYRAKGRYTSMRRSVKIWLGIILACLAMPAAAFGWLGAGTSSAQVPPTGGDWQQISTVRPDTDFSSVFMAGVNSGIAVGKQGDRGVAYELQWMPLDGSRSTLRLTPVSFDFRAPLRAAVMVNQDVWVVGEQGLIARRQNGTWDEVANPVPDAQLLTLQMLGNGDEGWASGFRPTSGGWRSEPVIP
jgi:hypothetical protein